MLCPIKIGVLKTYQELFPCEQGWALTMLSGPA
jgi:hypothetical protein